MFSPDVFDFYKKKHLDQKKAEQLLNSLRNKIHEHHEENMEPKSKQYYLRSKHSTFGTNQLTSNI